MICTAATSQPNPEMHRYLRVLKAWLRMLACFVLEMWGEGTIPHGARSALRQDLLAQRRDFAFACLLVALPQTPPRRRAGRRPPNAPRGLRRARPRAGLRGFTRQVKIGRDLRGGFAALHRALCAASRYLAAAASFLAATVYAAYLFVAAPRDPATSQAASAPATPDSS